MDQLTSKQLSEWEAYDKLDPIGTWREDFRLAYLSSLLTNLVISIHGKKGTKHTTPMEFLLNWDVDAKVEPKKQSVEEMKQILMGLAKSQNKKETRRTKPPTKKTNT